MKKDSAQEKWVYREHTKVKHILLEKYLSAWIPILGKWNKKICYFDGFAGKGKYIDGTLGSPIIALKVADRKANYFAKLICVFIEKNNKYYKNLEGILEREEPKIKNWNKIEIIKENDEFANVIEEIFSKLEKEKSILVPSFFFVDPFGFSGIPFEIVKRILSNPRTEVFFTFVVRDIARFIESPQLIETFNSLFGTDEWKQIVEMPNREKALIELYRRQLHEELGLRYSLQFRVCESEKLRTLYYLIHSTNNFKGHSIMKGIMYNQSALGSFAYLGLRDISERSQVKLFNIHDIEQLKQFILEIFKGKSITYDDIQERICTPWYLEPPYIDKHYRKALKELEKDNKISVKRVTSKTPRGLSGKDIITFPQANPSKIKLSDFILENTPKTLLKTNIHYKEYKLLDGTKRELVSRVSDGSIIVRFDKTPTPKKSTDIVCPHFLELKWAYGCPYDCAWCYLKGTFRFRPNGISPVIKPYEKTKLHVERFLKEVEEPEILNTGEIADSLMHENTENPFSKFIIPIFERQNKHKVLFLTKSNQINNLLEIAPCNQVIISFSINAIPVSERWEKAPHVLKRIEAAKELSNAGYEVRIRIDPMVPINNWEEHYLELLKILFNNLKPERITLGSLRGLQSTINGCTDKTWVRYLKETSNWGKKIDFKTRHLMYSVLIDELQVTYAFDKIALCKETIKMWNNLNMDYKNIQCNCIW